MARHSLRQALLLHEDRWAYKTCGSSSSFFFISCIFARQAFSHSVLLPASLERVCLLRMELVVYPFCLGFGFPEKQTQKQG